MTDKMPPLPAPMGDYPEPGEHTFTTADMHAYASQYAAQIAGPLVEALELALPQLIGPAYAQVRAALASYKESQP